MLCLPTDSCRTNIFHWTMRWYNTCRPLHLGWQFSEWNPRHWDEWTSWNVHLSYKSMQSVEPTLSFSRLLCSGLLFLIPPILQRLLITHTHESQACLYSFSWRLPWKLLGVCCTQHLLPLRLCHAPGTAPGALYFCSFSWNCECNELLVWFLSISVLLTSQ